jgi:hypothetical protein
VYAIERNKSHSLARCVGIGLKTLSTAVGVMDAISVARPCQNELRWVEAHPSSHLSLFPLRGSGSNANSEACLHLLYRHIVLNFHLTQWVKQPEIVGDVLYQSIYL